MSPKTQKIKTKMYVSGFTFRVSKNKGQAALTAVIFLLFISLAIVFGFSALALRETKISRINFDAKRSYFLSEAGQEDAIYRIKKGKNISSTEVITLDNQTVTTNIVDIDSVTKDILSSSDFKLAFRNLKTRVSQGEGVSFHYGIQVGYLGLTMKNQSGILGNIFSNGSVEGDANASTTGNVVVSQGIAGTPDQENLGYLETPSAPPLTYNIRDVDDRQDGGQSFVPTITAEPLKIEFYVKKVGNPGDIAVKIVSNDVDDTPRHNQAIAFGQLNKENVSTNFDWVEMTFNSTGPITAGTKYWIIIDTDPANPTKYYQFGADIDTSYPLGTFLYTKNWSNTSAVWLPPENPPGIPNPGDIAFRIFLGNLITSIDELTILGDAHASTITNSKICGDAYLKNTENIDSNSLNFINNPLTPEPCDPQTPGNVIATSSDPMPQPYPISNNQITQWKEDGDKGNNNMPCDFLFNQYCDNESGDFKIENQETTTLGPVRVAGDFTVKNQAILTVSGTLHINGDATFEDNCTVKLDPQYGPNSGLIIVDGTVRVKNRCTFFGSDTSNPPLNPSSYLMLISTSPAITNPSAMSVENRVIGSIFHASNGALLLKNQSDVKQIFGHQISVEDKSLIKYETGLADVIFTSGPTGGWVIRSWQEIE
jgi:hypothetical protein